MIWALFTLFLWACGLAAYAACGFLTLVALGMRSKVTGYRTDPVVVYFMAVLWPAAVFAFILESFDRWPRRKS